MKRINKLWLFSLLAILIAGGMAFWAGYATNKAQKEELQAQLKDLTDKEKRSVVERRISAHICAYSLNQANSAFWQSCRDKALPSTVLDETMRLTDQREQFGTKA